MTPDSLIGQRIAGYKIESIIGRGGAAVVYRARRKDDSLVALKVLFPPPGAGPEIASRFQREARTSARLTHPAIIKVLDSGTAQGYTYMAMRLMEGETLSSVLVDQDKLDEASAADITWQLADALYYAHSRGVIHRDVKPSNIMLTDDGQAVLMDFGVALALDDPGLTGTGRFVGTPSYMAPEQAESEGEIDGRADLYALGVLLYRLVSGRTPFRGTTAQILHAQIYDEPAPPSKWASVSPEMEAIIMKAIAKKPVDRFQTGAEMAQALAQLGYTARAKIAASPKRRHRGRDMMIWVALLGITLVLGALYLLDSGTQAPPATPGPATVISQTCPHDIGSAFVMILAENQTRTDLGCPREAVSEVETIWQNFENGTMFSRSDLNLVYVLGADGRWFSTGNRWRDGDPLSDPALSPPSAGLRQPERGLGQVWRTQSEVQDSLGWATDSAVEVVSQAQNFEGGLAWFNPASETVFVLWNDGRYGLWGGD